MAASSQPTIDKNTTARQPDKNATRAQQAVELRKRADKMLDDERFLEAAELYEQMLSLGQHALPPEARALLHSSLGKAYHLQNKGERALQSYLKALPLFQRLVGEIHADTATTYAGVGIAYELQGKHARAKEYYAKALAIRRVVLGENHVDTARMCLGMASAHLHLDELQPVLELVTKARVIFQAQLGPDHIEIAAVHNCMGLTYLKQGHDALAADTFCKALRICQAALGEDNVQTARAHNNLAVSSRHLHVPQRVRQHTAKCLAFYEAQPEARAYASEHAKAYFHFAVFQHDQAVLHHDKAEFAAALKSFSKALAIYEAERDYKQVALTHYQMAFSYLLQHDRKRGLECLNKSLALYLTTLGRNHAELGRTHTAIAKVYMSGGDSQRAIEHYSKAIPIYLATAGSASPDTALAYEGWADVCEMTDPPSARYYYSKALECHCLVAGPGRESAETIRLRGVLASLLTQIRQAPTEIEMHCEKITTFFVSNPSAVSTFPDCTTFMATAYFNRGDACRRLMKHDDAVGFYNSALKLYRLAHGPDYVEAANTAHNMGLIQGIRGNMVAAIECLRDAHAGYMTVYGPNHSETLDAGHKFRAAFRGLQLGRSLGSMLSNPAEWV